MQFDEYTVALLVARPDAPELDEAEAVRLQDAHLSHLADLHELRGLSILAVDVARARALKEADPAVQAGLYTLRFLQWRVPAGLVSFASGRVPRSVAEVIVD